MMKRLALAYVALLVAWPAAAQVATVPVGSLMQTSTTSATLTLVGESPRVHGYIRQYGLAPEPDREACAHRPAPTRDPRRVPRREHEHEGDATGRPIDHREPDIPNQCRDARAASVPIDVPAGQRLKVVYSVPSGQQGQLRFYVGAPTPPAGAAPSGTRISQVGQSFIDSAGNKWSLAPRTDGGPGSVICAMASCSATPRSSFGRTR